MSIVDKAKAAIEGEDSSLEAVELGGAILMTLTRLKVLLAMVQRGGSFNLYVDELEKLIVSLEQ